MSPTIAVVQARMGSRRLYGKVLMHISDEPMIYHIIRRLQAAQSLDQIYVATSESADDDPIETYCQGVGIECFRGSEDDVLDRFYQLVSRTAAKTVVRVTGDCPLIDPIVVDRVVEAYMIGSYDYVSNTLRCTYPDGLDVEVFSSSALAQAWEKGRSKAAREHVTPYLRSSGIFRVLNVEYERDLSHHRWTVDNRADLQFVREIYARLPPDERGYSMDAVLRLLEGEPELFEMNNKSIRNEGYYRTLMEQPANTSTTLVLDRSEALRRRAERCIPSCTQTFSKGPTQFVQGASPVFLEKGQGCRVWDVDGNEFIDYPMALGALILGHNYTSVREKVVEQIAHGTTFSLPSPLEVEVAELMVELIPNCEMVRFGKNGSDATSGAVRLARAHTGRDVVVCCGYHGWQDWYIGSTSRFLGVPDSVRELTVRFDYNDTEGLKDLFGQYPERIACVIMEPVGVVEPDAKFLNDVRALCTHYGALLIFDEMITGFRLHEAGAQAYYNVAPDLSCFGKAMANGYPLSCITGPGHLMQLFDEVFFSFTFGGEAVSLAAALATIGEIRQGDVIPHVWEQGRRLRDGYNVIADDYGLGDITSCVGLPPRTVVQFDGADGVESRMLKSLFQQECHRRGVLFAGGHLVSASHRSEDIDETLIAYAGALEVVMGALETNSVESLLVGPPVQPVFRNA